MQPVAGRGGARHVGADPPQRRVAARIERIYSNAKGERFLVRLELEDDDKLDRAMLSLANRARDSKGGRVATALGGAVRVAVRLLNDEEG